MQTFSSTFLQSGYYLRLRACVSALGRCPLAQQETPDSIQVRKHSQLLRQTSNEVKYKQRCWVVSCEEDQVDWTCQDIEWMTNQSYNSIGCSSLPPNFLVVASTSSESSTTIFTLSIYFRTRISHSPIAKRSRTSQLPSSPRSLISL